MLWQHYVFRRGQEIHPTWDLLFEHRPTRLLYIAGLGFDVRAQAVMRAFVENLREARPVIEQANLLLVGFTGYELSNELREQTDENGRVLAELFKVLGDTTTVSIGSSIPGEEDISASTALRLGTEQALTHLDQQTDVVLDVSSLPRVVYLALMTAILHKLIPNKAAPNALFANGVNFQVLVAEDASLDARIRSEDPSNDLILIPGFSSALHAESFQDWPLVWFPILGWQSRLMQKSVLSCPTHHETHGVRIGSSASTGNRCLMRDKPRRPIFFWPTSRIRLRPTANCSAL
jgi:hypothetical protein